MLFSTCQHRATGLYVALKSRYAFLLIHEETEKLSSFSEVSNRFMVADSRLIPKCILFLLPATQDPRESTLSKEATAGEAVAGRSLNIYY